MSPSPQHRLEIDRLLLLREERLVRIALIERRIGEILGQPYPGLSLPPELPSRRKPAKAQKARKAAPVGSPPRTVFAAALRSLEPGETAYRITYFAEGEKREEVHPDRSLLDLLAGAPQEGVTPGRLVTLDEKGEVRAVLYENDEPDTPVREPTPAHDPVEP